MIPLWYIKINDLDGNLTPNGPNTPKNAKLISNKAHLCQSASQIQGNSYIKVFRVLWALILYMKVHMWSLTSCSCYRMWGEIAETDKNRRSQITQPHTSKSGDTSKSRWPRICGAYAFGDPIWTIGEQAPQLGQWITCRDHLACQGLSKTWNTPQSWQQNK
jgi:hypothetical protein